MSLDVIRARDIPKGKVMYVKDEVLSLKTEDIYKAKPHYAHLDYLAKPDLSVGSTNPDHTGGQVRSYYMPMNRRPRDLSLTTVDIELAQPKSTSWKGKRHTDPVDPNYQLPSCIQREPTPPRWNGRHTNDISDIELARPKVLHPERDRNRQLFTCSSEPRLNHQFTERTFDVQDINQPREKQKRCTNPLDPVYTVSASRTTSLHAQYSEERGKNGAPPRPVAADIGQVAGSKPRQLQWDNGEPHFSLLREDIAGTVPQRWVGSVPHNIYDPPEIRPMISFHDPADIPGAQVGSLKKGITTCRTVNPLNPRYPMLDGGGCQVATSSTPCLKSSSVPFPTPSSLNRVGSAAELRSRGPSGRSTPAQHSDHKLHSGRQSPGVTIKLPLQERGPCRSPVGSSGSR